MRIVYFLCIGVALYLLACNEQRHEDILKYKKHKKGYVVQFELEDSASLVHINNQFYRSEDGHLFEKTIADRESNGNNGIVEVIYFNGNLPQDIDPITFEQLNGWYARDKHAVYYYRPTSGGMLCIKMTKADRASFRLLQGHYKYAVDRNNFYNESDMIIGFMPDKTRLLLNNKHQVITMTCGKRKYRFEL
ncbi:hypothetical protein [Hymenobacter sp. 102]|uniref:hypothetical protein n=1 Tax=Hymenobacter sp. 102 TaxID=3403152 RepID=UPI003CE6C7FC